MFDIEFRLDGRRQQISSEASLTLAIRRGDLKPQTRVIVEEDGREIYVGPAGEFPWLAAHFRAVDPDSIPLSTEPPEPPKLVLVQDGVPEAFKPKRNPRPKVTKAAKTDKNPFTAPLTSASRPMAGSPESRDPEHVAENQQAGCGCLVLIIVAFALYLFFL